MEQGSEQDLRRVQLLILLIILLGRDHFHSFGLLLNGDRTIVEKS